MPSPKKIGKAGLNFAKSAYGAAKKKLMTPRDHTQGGKYEYHRIGSNLIKTKVNPK